jgi:glycosyltransferase involved in cell wall biosynthesis
MNGRIKILQVLGTLNPGGVESWLMNVLRALDTRKFQFEFCTLGTEAGLHAAEAERLGAVVHRCPRAPAATLGRRFRKILRAGRYDVVHSHVHLFSGAILRWASMENVAMRIAHSHNSRDGRPDSLRRNAYRRLMKYGIQRYSSHGLAASRISAVDLFAGDWKTDPPVKILHYGIDLRLFRETIDRNYLREQTGLPVNAPVVGHVGNFALAKNHVFFLDIAADVLRVRPDVHFLMVGDGPLREETEARARRIGLKQNMHFAGMRTDVPDLLRSCMDAFLFPSLWEGLPTAVLEAQAAGLACVISETISQEVILFPERVTQLRFSMGSEEWAKKTIEVLSHRKYDANISTKIMEGSDFCIERGLPILTELYAGKSIGTRVASN